MKPKILNYFKNFDLESEYSATQRTELDIGTLWENIKIKKEEKKRLIVDYSFEKLDVEKNETERSINTGAIPKLFRSKRDKSRQNKVEENKDLRFGVMKEQQKCKTYNS